jgi:hypothetical protein
MDDVISQLYLDAAIVGLGALIVIAVIGWIFVRAGYYRPAPPPRMAKRGRSLSLDEQKRVARDHARRQQLRLERRAARPFADSEGGRNV